MALSGHLTTVSALVRRRLAGGPAPQATEWSTTVVDPKVGEVRLTGRFGEGAGQTTRADARRLLVGVHGLGGSAESRYLWQLARSAQAAGWAVLRLNLRGADRSGEDFYHGGLTADLHAALADPSLAGYEQIVVVGYSLGGHMALRWATEKGDPRVAAVAAVCPPLDLAAGQRAIDRPTARLYRWYLLGHLREIHGACSRRREQPVSVAEAARISTLLEWDERIVAPRHGYEGARDYYEQASVASRLDRLRVPALLVATQGDPMVPASTVRGALPAASSRIDIRWVRGGGHVAFPRQLDLGETATPGLCPQLLAWVERSVVTSAC